MLKRRWYWRKNFKSLFLSLRLGKKNRIFNQSVVEIPPTKKMVSVPHSGAESSLSPPSLPGSTGFGVPTTWGPRSAPFGWLSLRLLLSLWTWFLIPVIFDQCATRNFNTRTIWLLSQVHWSLLLDCQIKNGNSRHNNSCAVWMNQNYN